MAPNRIQAENSTIFVGDNAIENFVQVFDLAGKKILVLSDSNTSRVCYPLLKAHLPTHLHLEIPAGESSKQLSNCERIWDFLSKAHFSRHDLVLNVGGGMICDLGGFAASCYKRGIDFVHFPTSLLAMADAAVGGKTGINLLGFKNQIGAFAHPKAIVLAAQFLETLPERELRAGFAEVLKHALIADPERWKKLTASQELPSNWIEIIAEAVHTKLFFTEKDPKEKGIRKALNFGHTLGHALESYFLHENPENPVLHGEAVAAGMWCEAWLTLQKGSLAPSDFESISSYLSAIYSQIHFTDAQIPSIAAWALQDKKNQGEEIRCVLLNGIGDFQIDQIIHLDEIGDAFRSYQSNYSQR